MEERRTWNFLAEAVQCTAVQWFVKHSLNAASVRCNSLHRYTRLEDYSRRNMQVRESQPITCQFQES